MQNVSAVDEVLSRQLGLETPCFVAQLLPQLMDLVRASRRLPLGEEHAIRRGSREFLQASRELGERSLRTAHRTLRFVDPNGHDSESTAEDLKNFNIVIDSIDSVLENADSCIKEALRGDTAGSVAGGEAEDDLAGGSGSTNQVEQTRRIGGFGSIPSDKVAKPQVRWRHLIDNERTRFVPRLIVKHNAKTPLSASIVEAQRKVGLRSAGARGGAAVSAAQQPQRAAIGCDGGEPSALQTHLDALGVTRNSVSDSGSEPLHPYDDELRQLSWDSSALKPVEAQRYLRMEDTPLVWIRTVDELRQFVDEIKATCVGGEIAVDVEHHDFRSFRGFVCLIQVSTRRKDFIIDPFNIFEEMHMLNEIFSDPKIVKVLHGADRDVIWLQRDFSVFFVNMFDTGLATRALRFQGGFSLANLVLQHCGVKLDKKYQTADWRERPLSSEMEHYARMDTHYLLYCYDCVRNALLLQQTVGESGAASAAGLTATEEGVQALRTVWEKSAELARTQYAEAPFDEANTAMRLCERFGTKHKPLDTRQFSVLRALLGWRDRLSRNLDESSNFVAPDACLWRVALALPSSASRLRSTCNPLPPTMQQRAQEVVEIVSKCEGACVAATGAAAAAAIASPAFGASAPPQVASNLSLPLAVIDDDGIPPAVVTPSAPRRNWPSRTCSSMHPVVRVSTGSHQSSNDRSGASKRYSGIMSEPTLATMFDSDSSDGEEADPTSVARDKADDISGKLAFAASPPAAPPPTSAAAAPPPVVATVPAAPAQATGPYELPQAIGRKKKKRKAGAAGRTVDGGSLGRQLAAEAAQTSNNGASGGNLEAEAELFRAALMNAAADTAVAPAMSTRYIGSSQTAKSSVATASVTVDGSAQSAVQGAIPISEGGIVATGTPRLKKKRKRAAEAAGALGAVAATAAPAAAVEDPYSLGAADTPATDDPYAFLSPELATTTTVAAPTGAASPNYAVDLLADVAETSAPVGGGEPRRKKKKKSVAMPAQDPYL
eukprot:TRINITY_DN22087_c0_g1_i1.p1 TRINITY_DN22087_c0_g1~~TRINITY_DN22087_c0_g1_i1.p1  ORF type:complete len:1001 (-),score=217.32 TRINITY_DN22087_c0_g1_i1:313-3315(-)